MHQQLSSVIDEEMAKIPPQYGEILHLWAKDGFDLKEIGAYSGLSVPAIKSRLHRARKRLKQRIIDTYGEGALLAA
jgi:RNA polymerase sigma-70 factor (ECF subfamily)